jgi:ubiquinone/menaquinone biosynthesis C-methylase UbiE
MVMIGSEIRERVFRDTKNHYTTFPMHVVSRPHIRFVRKYAGTSIVDLGCATGNYCLHLSTLGYTMKGADVNAEYIRIARERGVDAHLIEGRIPFDDASCDSVLLSEVLEHVENPGPLLTEARRIARKNVLITTPNSEDIESLQQQGVVYEHFADLDHKNFFTKESLTKLLQNSFPNVRVWKGDGLNPLGLFPGRVFRLGGKALVRARIIPPAFYFRLYAVADVR